MAATRRGEILDVDVESATLSGGVLTVRVGAAELAAMAARILGTSPLKILGFGVFSFIQSTTVRASWNALRGITPRRFDFQWWTYTISGATRTMGARTTVVVTPPAVRADVSVSTTRTARLFGCRVRAVATDGTEGPWSPAQYGSTYGVASAAALVKPSGLVADRLTPTTARLQLGLEVGMRRIDVQTRVAGQPWPNLAFTGSVTSYYQSLSSLPPVFHAYSVDTAELELTGLRRNTTHEVRLLYGTGRFNSVWSDTYRFNTPA